MSIKVCKCGVLKAGRFDIFRVDLHTLCDGARNSVRIVESRVDVNRQKLLKSSTISVIQKTDQSESLRGDAKLQPF